MSAPKYPAFRDNTTFWEGKRIAFVNSRTGWVERGWVESVTHVHRDGEKTARAVVALDPQSWIGSDEYHRVIIWPDHLDAVYPLFEP